MTQITYRGGPTIEEVSQRAKSSKIFKMSSNENPLGPSPLAVAAIRTAADGLNLYPARDDGRLCQALADLHGRQLTPAHFVSAVGGVELLELIARAFLQPGDEVILCPPTFGWYVKTTEKVGANQVFVPLKADTFAHDVDGILTAVTKRTRLVYICNPNNPTGSTVSTTEMKHLLQELPPHVTVIADEVYHHFVQQEAFADSVQFVPDEHNIIVIHTFSKGYGLAGLRLGYAIAKPSLIETIRTEIRPYHHPLFAIEGGTAALKDETHLQRSVALVTQGKQYLYEQFARLGIRYWPSAGNFVLIQPAADAEALNEQLLERGIMIRSTANNGLPGCFRVTVGLAEANQALIAALEEILNHA